MALAVLSVDLVAKMATFERDLKRAASASEAQARRMTVAFEFVKGALVGMAGAISVGAFAGALKSVADYGDGLAKMSARVGVATEQLSALTLAASYSDVSNEQLGTGLKKLSQTMQEAAAGNERYQRILKALGTNETRDVNKAFLEIADRFSQLNDGAGKTALAMAGFGKAGADLIPLLNGGSKAINDAATQAQEFGLILDDKAAKAAERFNDNLTEMQKRAEGLKITLLSGLIPAINQIYDDFKGFGAKMDLASAAGDVLKFNKELKSLEARKDMKFNFAGNLDKEISDAGIKLAEAKAKFNALDVNRPKGAGGGRGSVNPANVTPAKEDVDASFLSSAKVKASAAARLSDAERYLESLQKQLERTQELSAVEQVMLDISKQRLGSVSSTQEAALLNIAKQIDAVKAQAEAEKLLAEAIKQTSQAQEDFFDSVMRADDAKRSQIATLLGATQSAETERQREDMRLLTTELEQGRISEELYLDAVSERLGLTADKLSKTKTLADELNLSFTSAFEDAIVGGKGLSEVLKGLEQDLIRIITRKMVTEPLGNALTGAIGGSGFNPGDFISKLFSFDGGGYTGGGARSGGMDGKGGFMAMLHPKETVIDHSKGQRSGNNVNLVVNQSFAPNTSRATTMQAASDARRQLEYAGRNL